MSNVLKTSHTLSLSEFENTLLPSAESLELHSIDKSSIQVINDLSSEISKIPDITNPDKCKEEYLPYLAYAFKVDPWEDILTIPEKKALIRQSLTQHKYKGSVWSIKQALKVLDIKSALINWNQYGGEPYHFKVDMSIGTNSSEVYDQVRFAKATKLIGIYKNKRSVFDGFELLIPNTIGEYKINGGVVWTI